MYETWNLICNLISAIGTFCSFLAMLVIARNTNKFSQKSFEEEKKWKAEYMDLKRKESETLQKMGQNWGKVKDNILLVIK